MRRGARIGFCLNPDGVEYSSNQEADFLSAFGYDPVELTASCLREKLKGRFEASVGGSVGWEFPFGFCAQVSYHYCLTDLVETQYNPYNWVEVANHAHCLALTVGYAFGIGGR